MKNYIILDSNNKVTNIITSDTEPVGVTFKDYDSYPGASTGTIYIPDEDIFVGGFSLTLNPDDSQPRSSDEILFSGSTSLGITGSFSRTVTELSSSELSFDNDYLSIENYSWDVSESIAYFTIITGSEFISPESNGTLMSLNFAKQHADNYGLKWDLQPQYILCK